MGCLGSLVVNTISFYSLQILAAINTTKYTIENDLTRKEKQKLECGPMPNTMAAMPNIGGVLCSTPQSLADAHYLTAVH